MATDPLTMLVLAIIIMWIGATYLALSSLALNQRAYWS
jgi:hypothetical protein